MNVQMSQTMIALLALFVGGQPSWADEGPSSLESPQAESDVGTRTVPMPVQKLPGNPSGMREPALPSSSPFTPPSSPVSCIKHLFDGSFQRGQIPPSHYYSIAAPTFSRTSNPRIYSSETGLVVQEMSGVATGSLAMNLAVASVHLPNGAVIREIAVALHDTSSKENLHVALARSMPDLAGSALLITLESDCVQSPALTTMAATGLAIPFDSKYAHTLKLSVVPAKTQGMSAPSPQVSVYAIRIGYTMQ